MEPSSVHTDQSRDLLTEPSLRPTVPLSPPDILNEAILKEPFERIISYAHDQDHVHVHSHAILLHLEDSKYTHLSIHK